MASISDTFSAVLVPVHPAGWPFVAGFLLISGLLGLLWTPLFWIGVVLTLWCVYFFRDPARTTPQAPGWVITPADGVVQPIVERVPPPESGLGSEPMLCIGVFMNVFDVHVNRAPVAGKVETLAYHAGQFLNASLDKASDLNERQTFVLRHESGAPVVLVQIAGLVARRILAFAKAEQHLAAGERLGLIRFGSRCDVYVPLDAVPRVVAGQRAVAGETVLAELAPLVLRDTAVEGVRA